MKYKKVVSLMIYSFFALTIFFSCSLIKDTSCNISFDTINAHFYESSKGLEQGWMMGELELGYEVGIIKDSLIRFNIYSEMSKESAENVHLRTVTCDSNFTKCDLANYLGTTDIDGGIVLQKKAFPNVSYLALIGIGYAPKLVKVSCTPNKR